jgi:general secretion pathway protein G
MTNIMMSKRAEQGFTLIELMAVMAIIAILAGMILGISRYAIAKSDEAQALHDIETIKTLLGDYRNDHGYYPASLPQNNAPTNIIAKMDIDFYLKTGGVYDPWGQQYKYARGDQHGESEFIIYVWSRGIVVQGNLKIIGEKP